MIDNKFEVGQEVVLKSRVVTRICGNDFNVLRNCKKIEHIHAGSEIRYYVGGGLRKEDDLLLPDDVIDFALTYLTEQMQIILAMGRV